MSRKKMKKIQHIINTVAVSVLTALSATACLEKEPGSYIPVEDAMKTYDDARQHLLGIYSSLKSSALYSGYLTLFPDIQTDLVMASLVNTNVYDGIWEWTIRPANTNIEAIYGSLYAVIGNCNFYLERIENVMSQETRSDYLDALRNYTAQVYAVRALCYSELIKCFCEAYPATDDEAKNMLGVVLRTKYSESEPIRRASLYDSYQLVLSDLDKAEEYFDEDDEDPTSNPSDEYDNIYLSQAAVYAIRSRVALYMQKWEDAIKYSTYVIDNKAFDLSGTGYVTSQFRGFEYLWYYDQGTEVIWRIGFTGTSYGGALGYAFLHFTNDYTYFYPDYFPSEWVLNLYGSNDIRYGVYFASESVTGIPIGYDFDVPVPVIVKYFGNRSFTNSYNIYHVCMPKPLRLAEQYLIRAEAYCQTGDTGLAANDLTTLSQSRGGGSISVGTEWLETISNERVKELYLEGFRLQDLKRWKKGFERTPNSYSKVEAADLEITPDNPLYVWPIPQHEIEAPGSEIVGNASNQ